MVVVGWYYKQEIKNNNERGDNNECERGNHKAFYFCKDCKFKVLKIFEKINVLI